MSDADENRGISDATEASPWRASDDAGPRSDADKARLWSDRVSMTDLDAVIQGLARVVRVVRRVLLPTGLVGLVATVVIVVALLPWTLHSAGTVVLLVAVAAVGLFAGMRLIWHGWKLGRTLGNPEFLRASISELQSEGTETWQQLSDDLDAADQAGGGWRTSMRMLKSLPKLRSLQDLAERGSDIVKPLSPGALVLSAYAGSLVGLASFLALPVVAISLIGLALR